MKESWRATLKRMAFALMVCATVGTGIAAIDFLGPVTRIAPVTLADIPGRSLPAQALMEEKTLRIKTDSGMNSLLTQGRDIHRVGGSYMTTVWSRSTLPKPPITLYKYKTRSATLEEIRLWQNIFI